MKNWYKKSVVIFFSVILLSQTLSFYQPFQEAFANHQGVVFLPGGQSFGTFDANQEIKISGAVEFVISQCSNPDKTKSIPDSTNPIADVYIIRSSSVSLGAPLSDISGVPNVIFGSTIGGAFFDVTIGLTGPAGPIGEGTYSIVFDECQDGDFGVEDFIAPNAFEVKITTTGIPSLPSSFLATKASAGAKADSAVLACRLINAFLHGKSALGVFGTGGPPGGFGDPLAAQLINLINLGISNLPQAGDAVVNPEAVAANICIQNARTFEGIAADPPDPNFEQFTSLPQREYVSFFSNDPLLISVSELSNSNINEDALASSLLRSFEKYQGAEIEKRGSWALIHSRAIKYYSDLLSTQTSASNTFIDNLITQLSTDPTSFDSIFSDLQNLKTRLQNSGLTKQEKITAQNLGLSPQQIDEAINVFTQNNFDVTTSSIVSDLEDLKIKNNAFDSDLNSLSVDIQSIITTLENDVLSVDETPNVNPGGPYAGIEGTLISFDGTASSSNLPIILYEWDLDGDAEFNDATGPNPTFTYNEPFDGYVGLRVTNSIDKSNVGYSKISISDSNRIPTIESFNPLETFPSVEIGNSLTFSISTSDPDGDPVTNQWFVNSILTETGDLFNFQSDPNNLGFVLIEVIASDDNPLGGSVEHKWIVNVLDVDNDLDGWRANVDCDDDNENVNPGQEEIPGNGLDDDCNSDTADVGEEPVADFSFFPESPYVNRGIQFNDRSSDDIGIVSYEWDFGDGNTSFEPNPMHMYANTGDYTVGLRVTDGDGNTDSVEKGPIPVQGNPPQNVAPFAFDIPIPTSELLRGSGGFGVDVGSGDLNNDGCPDIVVVSRDRFASALVYLCSGQPFDTTEDVVINFDAGQFGSGVSLDIGDINGDGIDDLVIGAPFSDHNLFLNGAVFIAFGGDGFFDGTIDKVLELDRPVVVDGATPNPEFGSDVAVGDVNNDQISDIIVGVPRARYDPFPFEEFGFGGEFENSFVPGEVHIFFGSSNTISTIADVVLRRNFEQEGFGPSTGEVGPGMGSFARQVAAGDVNGDGIDDIIVGCPECNDIDQRFGNNGKVMVYFGRTDAFPQINVGTGDFQSVYDLLITRGDPTPVPNANLGRAVTVGDVNGDGFDDIISGSPSTDFPRLNFVPPPDVRIHYGGPEIDDKADVILSSPPSLLFFSWSLTSADFNGDGIDDILAGATGGHPLLGSTPGAAGIIFGDLNGPTGIDRILRPTNGGHFGISVAAEDFNQDGFDDALIGVPRANEAEIIFMPAPITTKQNTPVEISLEGKVFDPNPSLQFFESGSPSNGILREITSTGPESAVVSFTPNLGFIGNERFSYKSHDGVDISNLANVFILVNPDQETEDVTPPFLRPPRDILVQATGPNGQEVNLGVPIVADNLDPNPQVTNDAPQLFLIGTTLVTWTATDATGNSFSVVQKVTVRDDLPPQIEILSPNNGDQFNEGQAIDILVNAEDNIKVERVEFFVDGNKISQESQSPFAFLFSAPILQIGDSSPRTISLEAKAFDLAGQSSSASINIRVLDVTPPPTPNLILPPDTSLFFNENPILAWKAVEDPSHPIQYVAELFNSDTSQLVPLIQLGTLAARASNLLADGNYQWHVMSQDAQGNSSPFSNSFTFSIDTIPPPSTNLISPSNGAVLNILQPSLEWEDVKEVGDLFYLPRLESVDDSGVPIEIVSLSLTSAQPINVLPEGSYRWSVTVQDLAGNTAPSSVFAFSINTSQGPSIQDIIDNVNMLVTDGKLNSARGNSLIAMLLSAQSSLDDGDDSQTKLKLESFKSRINNFIKRGYLSQQDGQSLTDLTNQVINAI